MTLILEPATEAISIVVECDPQVLQASCSDFLQDESKIRAGYITALACPRSTEEVSQIMNSWYQSAEGITVSGSRTGLCGGAVPTEAGHVLSLTKLKQIEPVSLVDGIPSIRVGAGTTLEELRRYLLDNNSDLFFPVDPTETSASVGGAVSTNASGARSYYYGSMRDWVMELRAVTAAGEICTIRRGEEKIASNAFTIERDGKVERFVGKPIPKPKTKNVIGYNFFDGLDLIDLFIGSEGTLVLVTEIVLRLAPVPESRLYVLQFFESENQAFQFVNKLRGVDWSVLAIEFSDQHSLNLVRSHAATIDSRAVQMLTPEYNAAVFCDIAVTAQEVDTVIEGLSELLDSVGASFENSIAGVEDRDLRDIKIFRHAIPETINRIVAERKRVVPGLHKISTDMSVPVESFVAMHEFYKQELEAHGFEYYMFGHIGDNHLHVNIVPRTVEELHAAMSLYRVFAEKVVSLNGAVAAEHGIGRIKKPFLKLQYTDAELGTMRRIKSFFDPLWKLNPGVLLDRN